MKRFFLVPLAMVVVCALALGSAWWPVRQAEAAADKIKVGVCTGLTGPFAGFGEGGVFGIRRPWRTSTNRAGSW